MQPFRRRAGRLKLTLALAGALSLAGSAVAHAQEPGFYVERFEPLHAQGINLLNLGTSEVLGHLKPTFGLFVQYIDDPLELIDEGSGDVLSRVIKRQIKTELWFGLGLGDFFDIGLVVPIVLNQAGDDLSIFSRPGEAIGSFALGDLRLVPKFRIINAENAGGFGLGFLVNVAFPTGSADDFTSDGEFRVEPRLLLDWTHADSGFAVVANVGYHWRPRRVVHNLVIDDAITWGAGLRIPTPLTQLKVLASVFGQIPLEDNIDPNTFEPTGDLRSTPIELVGALELSLGDFVTNVGAGFGLTEGYGSPDYRLFLSFGYVPRCPDRDGDGVCDPDDRCPDLPGPAERDGCPDPDSDGDGICDPWVAERGLLDEYAEICKGIDQCPYEPEDFDGFEDEDGCPDPDNDGDGICDPWVAEQGLLDKYKHICKGIDQCPNDPEDFDGFEDEDGCPDPDNDGDGICDPWVAERGLQAKYADVCTGIDQCPDEPEDFDGFEDEDGCPDPDNDGDGVLDVDDGPQIDPKYPGFGICRDGPGPTEAELRAQGHSPPWRYHAPDTVWPGCETIPIPRCECGRIEIPYKIQFRYNQHRLTTDSERVLDQVAEILRDRDCIAEVRVEGHTDWHGPTAANDRLSERRAQAVVDYLTRKGMAPGRFVAHGYGERLPLDPNDQFRDQVCRRCEPGCTCEPGSPRDPNPREAEIRQENRRSVFRVTRLLQPEGTVIQCEMPYPGADEVRRAR